MINLSLTDGSQTIMSLQADGMVLMPSEENERAVVFKALTDALAMLCGVTQPRPTSSTEAGSDVGGSQTGPDPADHTGGVVVRPSRWRGSESGSTSP